MRKTGNERKILKIYSMLVKSTKEKNKEREVSEQHRPFPSSTVSLLCHWSFQGLRHESETRGHSQVPMSHGALSRSLKPHPSRHRR